MPRRKSIPLDKYLEENEVKSTEDSDITTSELYSMGRFSKLLENNGFRRVILLEDLKRRNSLNDFLIFENGTKLGQMTFHGYSFEREKNADFRVINFRIEIYKT